MEKLSTENINTNCSGFETFPQIFAPCKKKHSQGYNMPFMGKPWKMLKREGVG